ncbi:MAG: hypothetical protein KDB14_33090, partial [Planctomycetales bacterium]|nr:hypothetical protein [Planctomycetales bacterium]
CSDDLFEIDGTSGDEPDEIGCWDHPEVVKVHSPSEGGLHVVACYAPKGSVGCWAIGLMQLDEDVEIPSWPMEWKIGGRGYSVELTLTVPDDAVVSKVDQDG